MDYPNFPTTLSRLWNGQRKRLLLLFLLARFGPGSLDATPSDALDPETRFNGTVQVLHFLTRATRPEVPRRGSVQPVPRFDSGDLTICALPMTPGKPLIHAVDSRAEKRGIRAVETPPLPGPAAPEKLTPSNHVESAEEGIPLSGFRSLKRLSPQGKKLLKESPRPAPTQKIEEMDPLARVLPLEEEKLYAHWHAVPESFSRSSTQPVLQFAAVRSEKAPAEVEAAPSSPPPTVVVTVPAAPPEPPAALPIQEPRAQLETLPAQENYPEYNQPVVRATLPLENGGETELMIFSQGEGLTLYCKNVPIHRLVDRICREKGLQLIISRPVSDEPVSLDLQSCSPEEILLALGRPGRFNFSFQNQRVYIY